MNLPVSLKEHISSLFKSMHAWFAHQLDDQKSQGTIAALDGVRAVACIMVVIFHSTGIINTYWGIYKIPFFAALNLFLAEGVTLFFLLSGFLLFLPYAQALLFEKRWPQARIFYLRRILRIVPGYFFSLFAIVLLAKPYYFTFHNGKTLLFFLTFLMSKEQAFVVNPVYWSLAIEFQYYILLPLIALGISVLTRLVHPKRRLWVVIVSLLAMVTWGLAARFWGEAVFGRPDALSFLASHPILKGITFLVYGSSTLDTGKYLEDFAIGMLSAVCYIVVTNPSRGDIYRRVLLRLSPWLWWIGIALLVFAAWRNDPLTARTFEVYPHWAIELAFSLAFGCCMLAILFNGTGVLKRFFEWTPLRWVGLISFSLFLWHFPVIDLLNAGFSVELFKHFRRPLALGLYAVVECVIVFSLSFTLYMMVEKPGMRLSERLRNKMLTRPEPSVADPTVPSASESPVPTLLPLR